MRGTKERRRIILLGLGFERREGERALYLQHGKAQLVDPHAARTALRTSANAMVWYAVTALLDCPNAPRWIFHHGLSRRFNVLVLASGSATHIPYGST